MLIIIVGLLRFWETLWLDKHRERGKIIANWTIILFGISYTLTMIIAISEVLLAHREINLLISGIGLFLLLIRLKLKLWAVKTLDKYWSSNIEIRPSQRLIKRGPYQYLRHPVYLGRLIDITGMLLVINAYYTLAISLPIHIVIIMIRIHIEEDVLVKQFGTEYIKYRQEICGLLPIRKTK